MKLLALVFLVGFALISAVPVPSHDLSLKEDDLEYIFALAAADDDDIQTELGKKLKEHLDEILGKIKEAIEHGKSIKEDYIEKAKEIREKLTDLRVDIGNRARKILDELRENAKDYWKNIWNRITGKDKPSINMHAEADDDDVQTELGKKLQEQLDEILEKIKEAIEHGKSIKEDYIQKLKEIREKIKDARIDVGKKAKELFEQLKEKAGNYWQKILDRLKGKEKRSIGMMEANDDDVQTELGKKLQEHLNEILGKIKEAIDQGKGMKEEYIEKLKDIREKMKDMHIEMGKQAKDLLKTLKEKAKDYWQKILDRLTGKEKRSIDMQMAADEVNENELRNKLDEILEKIKDAFDHGKVVKEEYIKKLMEIHEKMRELHIDLGKQAKDLFEKLKVKVKDYWQKILDRITGKEERSIEMHVETVMMDDDKDEIRESWNNRMQEILKKVEEAIEKGHVLSLETISKINHAIKELLKFGEGMSDKACEMLEEMIKKAEEKKLTIIKSTLIRMRDISCKPRKERSMSSVFDYLRKVKKWIVEEGLDAEKIKEKIKNFDGHNDLAEQLMNKLREKGDNWKQKILEFIDKHIPDREKRSIKETYDKIKEYLKNLQIELKEKFVKFGEWAKDKYEKGLKQGKNKAENIQKLAREFIADAKDISKDVAEQAKEFFKEYKEDVGIVYEDLREKIREILSKH